MRHKSMHGVVELILMMLFRSSTTWYLDATCMMENRATQIALMSTIFLGFLRYYLSFSESCAKTMQTAHANKQQTAIIPT